MKSARGFTVLEVLASLAVLGLLLVLLRQSVVFGLRGVGAYDRFAAGTADLAPSAAAWRHAIEAMDAGTYTEPPTPRGTAALFAFLGTLPAAEGFLRAQVAIGLSGENLVLRWSPDPHAERLSPAPPPHEEILARGVARAKLRYAARDAGAGWQDEWTADALPGLVRLDVAFRPGVPTHWPSLIAAPAAETPDE